MEGNKGKKVAELFLKFSFCPNLAKLSKNAIFCGIITVFGGDCKKAAQPNLKISRKFDNGLMDVRFLKN